MPDLGWEEAFLLEHCLTQPGDIGEIRFFSEGTLLLKGKMTHRQFNCDTVVEILKDPRFQGVSQRERG